MVPGPWSPPIASMAMRMRAATASSFRLPAFSFRLLRFLDGADLTALVVAAVRTYLVRRLRLAALRTRADGHSRQRVVRPSLGRARLRVPAFGVGHRQLSLSRFNSP